LGFVVAEADGGDAGPGEAGGARVIPRRRCGAALADADGIATEALESVAVGTIGSGTSAGALVLAKTGSWTAGGAVLLAENSATSPVRPSATPTTRTAIAALGT
jgi:hypothetical protein